MGNHCRPWDKGGALKGRFKAERRPFVTTLQNVELNQGRNCSHRDTWTSRFSSQMYGILLGTQDHQVRGVRGQLDQDRFGFAALIKHFGAEGEISDKLERQEHLMLPVHLQTCSYTRKYYFEELCAGKAGRRAIELKISTQTSMS